jgi:hypothetical protein
VLEIDHPLLEKPRLHAQPTWNASDQNHKLRSCHWMGEESMIRYIRLSDTIVSVDRIVMLKADGCWGEIMLTGMTKPYPIGDGSYWNDGKHVQHWLAQKPDGSRDFGFTILNQLMVQLASEGVKPEEKPDNLVYRRAKPSHPYAESYSSGPRNHPLLPKEDYIP